MDDLASISELTRVPGPVHLAIGVFDGVHRGHQKVICRALNGAARDGGNAVVVTFEPHPEDVLRPGLAPPRLTPLPHQRRVLERLGVNYILAIPFDQEFARIEAEAFVEMLAGACGSLKRICVGYDWRFGKDRAGDIHLLADLGRNLNFEFTAIPSLEVSGETVSSTLIRKAVADGDLTRASTFLGRNFSLFGSVTRGDGRGKELGFPTANIEPLNGSLPPIGVYVVRCESVDGTTEDGVANLGVRPTVDSDRTAPVLEVHLFDYEGDLYGCDIEVSFVDSIRPEMKFDSLDALKNQIAADVERARRLAERAINR